MIRTSALSLLLCAVSICSADVLYTDALVFDADGDVRSIDYRSDASLPTALVYFGDDGLIEKIFQQEALDEAGMFRTEMPVDKIERDEYGRPVTIRFKTIIPDGLELTVNWMNGVATEFSYVLGCGTRYVRETDANGITESLRLYVRVDDSAEWQYCGKVVFSDYCYDEHNNWIRRNAVFHSENSDEYPWSYSEERIIEYR